MMDDLMTVYLSVFGGAVCLSVFGIDRHIFVCNVSLTRKLIHLLSFLLYRGSVLSFPLFIPTIHRNTFYTLSFIINVDYLLI